MSRLDYPPVERVRHQRQPHRAGPVPPHQGLGGGGSRPGGAVPTGDHRGVGGQVAEIPDQAAWIATVPPAIARLNAERGPRIVRTNYFNSGWGTLRRRRPGWPRYAGVRQAAVRLTRRCRAGPERGRHRAGRGLSGRPPGSLCSGHGSADLHRAPAGRHATTTCSPSPRPPRTLGFDAFFRSDHYLAMGDGDGLPGPTDAWITLAGLARETTPDPARHAGDRRPPSGCPARWRSRSPRSTR